MKRATLNKGEEWDFEPLTFMRGRISIINGDSVRESW